MSNLNRVFLAFSAPFLASAFTPATLYSANLQCNIGHGIFSERNSNSQPLYSSSVEEETMTSNPLMEVCTKAANALDDCADAVANTKDLFAEDATFDCQAPGLSGITTAKGYAEFMEGIASWGPGATYDVHNQVWDETTKSAMFFPFMISGMLSNFHSSSFKS